MASRDKTVKAWYQAVTTGKMGQSARSSTYWYRDKFLYHLAAPVARLEKALDGSWHFIINNNDSAYIYLQVGTETYQNSAGQTYQRAAYLNRVDIFDIGKRTEFKDEPVLEGGEWHLYVLWQLKHKMLDMLDVARASAVKAYIDYPFAKDRQLEMTNRYYAEHELYRGLFCPHLPKLVSCAAEVEEIINSKINAYNDPKAIERRERAKARKLAVEALGLNNGD